MKLSGGFTPPPPQMNSSHTPMIVYVRLCYHCYDFHLNYCHNNIFMIFLVPLVGTKKELSIIC